MSEFSAMFENALAAERSAPASPIAREVALARATRASRRRREVRAGSIAFSVALAVGGVGVGAWAVINHDSDPAVPVPSASPSPSESATPTPSESLGIIEGGVDRLERIEDWSTEGNPAYPPAEEATAEIVANVTDYWSLVTVQDTTVLDPETGLPRLPIAVYLVSPDDTYYLVMKLPAWYGTHYRLLDWQPRTGWALLQTASGTETFVLDFVGRNRFEAVGQGQRLGIASDERTYWAFTFADGESFTVATWEILTSEQWAIVDFPGATLPTLQWDNATGAHDQPLELVDHGEWIAYPTATPQSGPLEAINLVTRASVRFSGPGGDATCVPLHWRTATELLLSCPNSEPGTFSVDAPTFADPVPFTGFVTVSDELLATGTAEIPGTGVVLGSAVGSDVVTSISVKNGEANKRLQTFDPGTGFVLGTVRQPRSGVYVLGELGASGDAGLAVVVDVAEERVRVFEPPSTAVDSGAYWLRLIYVSPAR